MTIAELVAGPELDGLIAERVFGQTPQKMCWRYKNGRCNGDTLTVCGACGRTGHANCYGNGSGPVQIECCRELPSYSESVESAWLVVEKLREQATFHLGTGDPNGPTNCWASFVVWDRNVQGVGATSSALADSVPLAICRAALLALESA